MMFVNSYGSFSTTNPLRDFTATPNENAVVDILKGGANAFTVNPTDIVTTLFGPGVDAGANPNPYTAYSFDLGALAAGTYQIRFAETDNQGFFNMGVDAVGVDATVNAPEPATLSLMGAGLFGLMMARRRKAS